jgi:RNA polymerase sigma-70 factor (ECF subfamily)
MSVIAASLSPLSPLDALGAAEREALVAHLRPLVGRAGDAEDLAHDALVRGLERPPPLDPTRSLLPWLKTVARHIAIDALRRRACVRFHSLDAAAEPSARRDAPGPDDGRGDGEVSRLRAALGPALASLPERERSAVSLFYEEGRGIPEIAARMGAPAGTVKSWLHRARERLRARLLEAVAGAAAAAALLLALGGALGGEAASRLSREREVAAGVEPAALLRAAAPGPERAAGPVDVDRILERLERRRARLSLERAVSRLPAAHAAPLLGAPDPSLATDAEPS